MGTKVGLFYANLLVHFAEQKLFYFLFLYSFLYANVPDDIVDFGPASFLDTFIPAIETAHTLKFTSTTFRLSSSISRPESILRLPTGYHGNLLYSPYHPRHKKKLNSVSTMLTTPNNLQ